jgi:hypothetical protein
MKLPAAQRPSEVIALLHSMLRCGAPIKNLQPDR